MTQILTKSNLDKDIKQSLYSLTSPKSQPLQLWVKLRQRLLVISTAEATVARRGFKTNSPHIQQRLETIGKTFLQGYHAAISDTRLESLIPHLNTVEAEWRGFAYEGAGMGLALLDGLTPWKRNRLQQFLADAGGEHIYMVYVGMGWALARLPWGINRYLKEMEEKNLFPDPLLGWLALDGYGFHQGYFYWHQYVERIAIPKKLSGYAYSAFDQGLGRSLWFVYGADINLITQAIQNFPPNRRADLWSGVGLACTYAGGVSKEVVQFLSTAAGTYLPQLCQGAAFAAKARLRAENLTNHTEMACQVLCGISAEAAADITDKALENLPYKQRKPAYEIWRQRIQAHFAIEELIVNY
ncbi:MAG: DUF1702 family protein [Okeania sp. SIO3B5]|uniref:DUF1702 family protein n=1 Tax=Okeania sp. SIO3B5 TaxID=2607811 RepID=UPI0013FEF9F7|nr:DUF1702 family protein [Okeania sp. SIO3B5]NEO55720.1 DUF1702 family protein [Okeania sp. SIO3B5]